MVRKTLHKSSIVVLAFSLAACGKTTQPVIEKGITEAGYRTHIKTLSSDAFGGRAPASAGETLTITYIADQFKSYGLSPANGNQYLQDVPLAWVRVDNAPTLTINSESKDTNTSDLSFSYGAEHVVWTRNQGKKSALKDSELVFVGYGINAPERNWNDYADIDVEGKTVIMLVNDPGYATQDETLFNGNAMTYYGRWDYKFDEAARQGAAGAIIIHDTKPAAYPWSTVENSWTGKQFDTVRETSTLAAVEGWIQKPVAEKIFTLAGFKFDEMYALANSSDFKAIPLNLKASIKLETSGDKVASHNVAALLKGSQKPDEIFIYMAHWDHLGTDTSIDGDGIYNGALDNATGIAGLLELAKTYANLERKPKRSILFLAVTAEEQGLLGSAHYASHPLFPLAQTVAGLNMDGLNYFGRTKDITVIGLGASELDAIITKHAANQGRTVLGDRFAEKGSFYRSDHFELAKFGVPMLYPKQGIDHREKGIKYGKAVSNDYTANRYHRVTDEYDPNWDVRGALEDLNLYFETGLEVANSSAWPNWHEGNEFKAIRDTQRAHE